MWTSQETLGSVKHEGPATRMLQTEGVCQALTIAAFTSSCQMNVGSLPLGPPGHHCLQPLHGVEERHCFFAYLRVHSQHSRDHFLCFSRHFGLTLRLSRSCLFRCIREIPAALDSGTCASHRARWHRLRLFSCGIPAARSCDLVFCILLGFLLCILTNRCGEHPNSSELQVVSLRPLFHAALNEVILFCRCCVSSITILRFNCLSFAFSCSRHQDRKPSNQ